MRLLDLFRRKPDAATDVAVLARQWSDAGIEIRFSAPLREATVDFFLASTDKSSPEETFLAAYLSQLVVEGRCSLRLDGLTLPWPLAYALRTAQEHAGVVQSLGLPEARELTPILDSEDTLADATFEIVIDGWADGGHEINLTGIAGAVVTAEGKDHLLPEAAWAVYESIRQFSRRGVEERTQHKNELAWGTIRAHADAAGALYKTPYLETTFVLTPHTLRLPMKRDETPFGRVLTVEPTFEGAPSGWMKAFDGFNSVQPHYDLTPPGGGHVRIVISEPVRKVLEVIKREMPGRRVAGSKAERFVHNPWAFLGEAAHEVLNEEDFAQDKAGAGALAALFSVVPRTQDSRIERVDLVVTEHFHGGGARTETTPFESADAFEAFVGSLDTALRAERLRFAWDEYDLTIDGDSGVQLEHARQVLHLWRLQPTTKISFEDIYELDGYSGRIEGIGIAKPIYVPIIQRPSSEDEGKPGWIPGDLTPMVRVTLAGHEGQVVIPLSKDWVADFEAQVTAAEATGANEVVNSSLPTPVGTSQARTLVDSFSAMLGGQEKVKPDGGGKPRPERPKRETLLVKMNFHGVDYAEERRLSLTLPQGAKAELPNCLRPSIKLKNHQFIGIAWFQHLVSCAPGECRGALLADDMGLGKTLQLLSVLGWYYEKNPDGAPSIILAPKTLVDNWATETRKFFDESFPELISKNVQPGSCHEPVGKEDGL